MACEFSNCAISCSFGSNEIPTKVLRLSLCREFAKLSAKSWFCWFVKVAINVLWWLAAALILCMSSLKVWVSRCVQSCARGSMHTQRAARARWGCPESLCLLGGELEDGTSDQLT